MASHWRAGGLAGPGWPIVPPGKAGKDRPLASGRKGDFLTQSTRILITGAAGRIGRVLRDGLRRDDRILRLVDIADLGTAGDREELVRLDVTDLGALEAAMEGVDCVVHLAAIPEEQPWDTIFPLNFTLTYNVFEAARHCGVRRVVFASSIQAVGFHPRSNTLDITARLRPSGYYGVSKAFGEAMANLYADKHGLSVACVRIASFQSKPINARMLVTWLSHPDAVHLFDRCIDADDYHFLAVYGVSNNTQRRVDNSHVAWLGYDPQDDAERFRAEIEAQGSPEDPIGALTHGGSFCDMDFSDAAKKFLDSD